MTNDTKDKMRNMAAEGKEPLLPADETVGSESHAMDVKPEVSG